MNKFRLGTIYDLNGIPIAGTGSMSVDRNNFWLKFKFEAEPPAEFVFPAKKISKTFDEPFQFYSHVESNTIERRLYVADAVYCRKSRQFTVRNFRPAEDADLADDIDGALS